MKTRYLTIIFVLVIFSSCMRNEYLVESDYSYRGKFKKYNSFGFMTDIGINSDSVNQRYAIEEAIKRRMNLQGYKYKDNRPDILVSYKMFYDEFKFNGFYQPDFTSWLVTEDEDEVYEPVKYKMYEGTIIVILWDRKQESVVWQGYATTIFGNPNKNNKYINWAVRSIFDQYRVFGEEYEFGTKLN